MTQAAENFTSTSQSESLKSFIHRDCDRSISPFDRGEYKNENGTFNIQAETLSDQAFQEFLTDSDLDESLFYRNPCPDAVSASEIRVDLACHTIGYTRALLAAISQIAFFWARQAVTEKATGSMLSQLLKLGQLPVQDAISYSTEWASKQMQSWWGKAYSAASFRNVRKELAAWGCFEIEDRGFGCKKGDRRPKATRLLNIDIARLLEIAALAFKRLCDEPDGWDKFIPGHRCGFLAGIWGVFHSGTFYAPDSDPAPEAPIEDQIEVKRSAMDKARSLAREFQWNAHLVEHYELQAIALARQIGNLEDMLYADF